MHATAGHLPTFQPVRRRRSVQRARRARTLRWLAVLLVAFAVLVFAPRIVHTMDRTPAAPTATYIVAPGDTLWDIAAAHSGREDVRKVVAAIKRANQLNNSVVQPGQRLVIPQVASR